MAATDKKLYRFHVTNIHSIEIALNHSALAARSAIAENNKPAIKSFVSLNALLLGAWAENRLRKLLYENNGLSAAERELVTGQPTQLDQWLKVIEVAFRKHYNIPNAPLNDSNLPFSANARYSVLKEILERDLRSVIEIRNKLAHGQWVYPLNSDGTDIEDGKYQQLKNENLPSLQYKKSLLTSLADIVHDLVVSLPTFERDFDRNYKKITNTRSNLNNRSYEKYAAQLVAKRTRGIQLRNDSHINAINSDTQKPRSFLARLLGAGYG
jgi:hypothetical protein